MRLPAFALAALMSLLAGGVGCTEELRLNEIQVIGTHNSYHAGLPPAVAALIAKTDPSAAAALDYRHAPLTVQLDQGVRQIELDIYADAAGGRFAHPLGARLGGAQSAGFDPQGLMTAPGFKVMHLQDLDYVSTCQPFIACLREVQGWSRAHPQHVPIFILVETKTQPPIPGTPMVAPEPFLPVTLDALDREVRSVFSPEEIITPDEVRAGRDSLDEAVRTGGWPSLAAARGRVIFLLDQQNVSAAYLVGHPALRGRVFFTNAVPGRPDAAFVEKNEGPPEEVRRLVRQGYLVRTRADADTKEGRSGSSERRDAALASGAQLVSTDYPWFEPAPWSGYVVALPGRAPARCDAVATPHCPQGPLEPAPPR